MQKKNTCKMSPFNCDDLIYLYLFSYVRDILLDGLFLQGMIYLYFSIRTYFTWAVTPVHVGHTEERQTVSCEFTFSIIFFFNLTLKKSCSVKSKYLLKSKDIEVNLQCNQFRSDSKLLNQFLYYRFGNFRENFIQRYIIDVKNSRPRQGLPILISDKVILRQSDFAISRGFYFH